MAEEQQDVYISGIAGSIDTWSKEVTQKSIETSLKQLNADSNGILRLLKATAKGVDLSADQLKNVGDSLKRQTQKVEENGDDANRNHEAEVRHSKGTFKALYDLHRGGNKKAAQFAADQSTRDKNANALHKLGYSEATSQRAANVVMFGKKIERLGKKLVAAGALVGAMIAEEKSLQEQGVMDRFNMVRDMRQMGLFAGQKEANRGMLEISKTISDTNFSFGEATEFTKRFSKAVGINGVKASLEFANAMADKNLGDPDGLMRKYSLQFGDVANMSGLYLESLRRAGQLENRSKDEMKRGMLDFMDGVESTSNVLKISMSEAADIMSKALTENNRGLLALLDEDQQEKTQTLIEKYDSLEGGKLMDTLTGMLAAGGADEFMITDQGQAMLNDPLSLQMLEAVKTLMPTFQNGTLDESSALMDEFLPRFFNEQVAWARNNKSLVRSDTGMQQMLGEGLEFKDRAKDLNAEIRTPDQASLVAMFSEETQRMGPVRTEMGDTYKLDSYIQNLFDTTVKIGESQLHAMNRTIAASDNITAIATNIGSLWDQLWLHVGGKIDRIITGTLNLNENMKELVTGDWSNMNWSTLDDVQAQWNENLPKLDSFDTLKTQSKDELGDHLERLIKRQNKLEGDYADTFKAINDGTNNSLENQTQYTDLYVQQQIVAKAIAEITNLIQKLDNP
jgi:hypothetical protein